MKSLPKAFLLFVVVGALVAWLGTNAPDSTHEVDAEVRILNDSIAEMVEYHGASTDWAKRLTDDPYGFGPVYSMKAEDVLLGSDRRILFFGNVRDIERSDEDFVVAFLNQEPFLFPDLYFGLTCWAVRGTSQNNNAQFRRRKHWH